MGFNASEISCRKFNNLKEVDEYILEEKNNIVFQPIEDFLANNSIFMDDEYFGRGTKWVKFNVEGFRSFCEFMGTPYDFMIKIRENDLTTKVLNDNLIILM